MDISARVARNIGIKGPANYLEHGHFGRVAWNDRYRYIVEPFIPFFQATPAAMSMPYAIYYTLYIVEPFIPLFRATLPKCPCPTQ